MATRKANAAITFLIVIALLYYEQSSNDINFEVEIGEGLARGAQKSIHCKNKHRRNLNEIHDRVAGEYHYALALA